MLLAVVAFGIYSIVALFAIYAGFAHILPSLLAIIAMVVCFMLRIEWFTAIACFIGAWKAWHWPWYGALAFTSPALLLLVPGVIILLIGEVKERFSR